MFGRQGRTANPAIRSRSRAVSFEWWFRQRRPATRWRLIAPCCPHGDIPSRRPHGTTWWVRPTRSCVSRTRCGWSKTPSRWVIQKWLYIFSYVKHFFFLLIDFVFRVCSLEKYVNRTDGYTVFPSFERNCSLSLKIVRTFKALSHSDRSF